MNVISDMFQKHVEMQDVWKTDVTEDALNTASSTFWNKIVSLVKPVVIAMNSVKLGIMNYLKMKVDLEIFKKKNSEL